MSDHHRGRCPKSKSPQRRKSKSPDHNKPCKSKECDRLLREAREEIERLRRELAESRAHSESLRQELEECKKAAQEAKIQCEREKEELREKIRELEANQCGGRAGHWVPAENGAVPPGAIVSGRDPNRPYYVARAVMDDNLVPGKLTPPHQTCWVPYNNTEIRMDQYEVLVDADCEWVAMTSSQQVPHKAVVGGYMMKDGVKETLFIGRANIDIRLVPGYVFESTRELLHSTSYKNEKKTSYEILVTL